MEVGSDYSKIFTDDIIQLLFLKMAKCDSSEEICHVKFQSETLHSILFESKKENPVLFSGFSFKLNGTYPYSEQIDNAEMRARLTSLISESSNSRYNYTMKNQVKQLIESVIEPKFTKNDQKILTDIAERISI